MFLQEPDIKDFLIAFNKCDVRYLIVGGTAVILHGYARTTIDLGVWVERSEENYEKICKAFLIFGMPIFDMTRKNFFENKGIDVFTFGRPPVCIDLTLTVKGLDFDCAFKNSTQMKQDGIFFNVVSKGDLILAKRASGRHKDLDDAEKLSKLQEGEK